MDCKKAKKHTTAKSAMDRRDFLKFSGALGAALAIPTIVPSSVFGANAPSNRINIGCIGVGRMGQGDLREILGFDQVRVVAVCDVDAHRMEDARGIVDNHYKARDGETKGACAKYGDFRDLLAREDIDAVQVVTPDHWHAIPAIAAAKAGKDIFIQKPMTLTIPEGRVLSDTVKRYGRVLQVGSQQRSDQKFRFACELVRNGRIGELKTVKVGFGIDPAGPNEVASEPPEWLDYEMWLGPAPRVPYIEGRVQPRDGYGRPGWLRTFDYCHGMITGWGSHHNDIAQWGMDTELTGPTGVEATADFPKEGIWDVHNDFDIEYTYPSGVKVLCSSNTRNKQGVVFEGTEGWVYVRRGFIDASPKSLLTSIIKPEETHLYESNDHKANWLECIRTRQEPIAPVEIGHRSNSVCVIGSIAMRVEGPLKWDPVRERFIDNDEANRLLTREMRSPWSL